jgi:hypothetical protein
MKLATPKQISFIRSLVAQTGAYQDGEGMVVNMTIYPRLDLEATLQGEASSLHASKIIEALKSAPVINEISLPSAGGVETLATQKQILLIADLLSRLGKDEESEKTIPEGFTKKQASEKISQLIREDKLRRNAGRIPA